MAQRRRLGQDLPPVWGAVTSPRNRRPAEIHRLAARVEHHFDDVRIEVVGQRVYWVCSRAHHALGALLQQRGAVAHQLCVDQWFVALHVDDHRIAIQAELPTSFGEAVAAAGVVAACQQRLDAVRLALGDDALVVGGHHHALRASFSGSPRHAHHHRQAGDVGQRLVR